MAIKRKRSDTTTEDPNLRIAGKLHHDMREARKAAKKAKTFETQKLARKLKSLRAKDNSSDELRDCEGLLEEMKVLNHEAVANTAVRTKLMKDKVLFENEALKAALEKELSSAPTLTPAPLKSHAAKAQSRFLSSKLLASEVALLVDDLRRLLTAVSTEQDDDDSSTSARPHKKLDRGHEHEDDDGDMDMDTAEAPDGIATQMRSLHLQMNDSDDDEHMDDGWESGTVNDEDSEAENELADDELEGEQQEVMMKTSSSNPVSPRPSKGRTVSGASANGASQFLPSLAVGYTAGDSDASDWSDKDDDDVAPKKNRRGQRARRAIWEKKYGRGANHKKKEAEQAEQQKKAKKTSSHRTPGGSRARKAPGAQQPSQQTAAPDGGWGKVSAPRPATVSAPAPKKEAELHPSWVAKMKQKERESAMIGPAIQNRKIKF